MTARLLILLLALQGCAEQPSTSPCLSLRQWSDVEQMNMKADLETLPDGSPLVGAMVDYARMRSQARACSGEK